jgi:thioredoxin 1
MTEKEYVVHVGMDDFNTAVLEADKPALVDFWAPWCFPCRMVAPTIEEVAKDYEGKVIVAKVNTDENGELAGSFGIQGIPTMILFKDGKEADRIVGAVPKKVLVSKLDALLK